MQTYRVHYSTRFAKQNNPLEYAVFCVYEEEPEQTTLNSKSKSKSPSQYPILYKIPIINIFFIRYTGTRNQLVMVKVKKGPSVSNFLEFKY